MKFRSHLIAAALLLCSAVASAAYVDRSGTITTGGTSQTLVSSSNGRGRIAISNPPTETELLCVNVTSAASCTSPGSWLLSPGETIVLETQEVVTIVAATTGHKFTAKENITDGFSPTAGGRLIARSGANLVSVSQASASAAINVSTATTTQIVALASGQVIHVTAASVIAGGAGNITFVYGTGSNCGTGTTSLTGAYPLIANAGLTIGSGLGPVLVVPAGNALCVTTSAAVQMSGQVAYTQFTP